MNFNERLNQLCNEKGVSKAQLERDLGLARGNTSKWKKVNPCQDTIIKIANYFGVSIDFLMGESDEMISDEMIKNLKLQRESKYIEGLKESTSIQIPVLGSVQAGIPIEAIEEVIDYEDIPEEWSYIGQYFGLKVKGDSMSPRIQEGDVLIVRKQEDAESGDIVIALTNSNSEATVKRLLKYAHGIRLIPLNPSYEPMDFPQGEDIKIIGKVVENRQKYD